MLVSELADGVRLLAGIVRDTREIVQAVSDGRAFLEAKHPEAREDFAALLGQMRVTVVGLAKVTKLLGAFRFNPAVADSETTRFNSYIVERRELVTELRGNISALKGNCTEIRRLRDELDGQAAKRNKWSLFGLLGSKAQERSIELSGILSEFYGADERMIAAIEEMLDLANAAVDDVDTALGDPGYARSFNVERAAGRLNTYAAVFKESQDQLDQLVADIDAQVRELTPKKRA